MKKFLLFLTLGLAAFAQPTPVQVVEATAAQVAAGTVGAPYYVSPRRLATGGGPGVFSSVTDTGLTAGRVTFAGVGGLLSDDSDLTFATDTLTATNFSLGAGTLKIPSTSTTGLQLYNTADQTTNYERLEALWTSNIGLIQVRPAGTGTIRTLRLATTNTSGTLLSSISIGATTGQGIQYDRGPSSTAGMVAHSFTIGTQSQTSGTNAMVSLTPTYNQASGTAANTDLLINRTQTAVGSGAQLLADFQVGGSSVFSVSNIGVLTGSVGTAASVPWTITKGATGRMDISVGGGSQNLAINASNVFFSGALITTPQALSGAGAVNTTTSATFYTSTGGAQALTLANGSAGQIKYIVHQVDGGSGVLTPTSAIGFTTITFTNVGDSVTLIYTSSGWAIVGVFGAVAA